MKESGEVNSTPVVWEVWPTVDPNRRVTVNARLWYEARAHGAALLGVGPLDADAKVIGDAG